MYIQAYVVASNMDYTQNGISYWRLGCDCVSTHQPGYHFGFHIGHACGWAGNACVVCLWFILLGTLGYAVKCKAVTPDSLLVGSRVRLVQEVLWKEFKNGYSELMANPPTLDVFKCVCFLAMVPIVLYCERVLISTRTNHFWAGRVPLGSRAGPEGGHTCSWTLPFN